MIYLAVAVLLLYAVGVIVALALCRAAREGDRLASRANARRHDGPV